MWVATHYNESSSHTRERSILPQSLGKHWPPYSRGKLPALREAWEGQVVRPFSGVSPPWQCGGPAWWKLASDGRISMLPGRRHGLQASVIAV